MKEDTKHASVTKHRAESPRPRARKEQPEEAAPNDTKDKLHTQKTSSPPFVLARTVQGLLLMGTRMVQQSMRNALSPLLVFMSAELDITTVQKGTLLSAIAAGYFFTQVPGGALADRLGAKNVMTAALGLSAMCCLVLPWCVDTMGVSGLWYIMMIMGSVQGPMFPTSTVYLSKWMPKKLEGQADEKAWGTSMLDIGVTVGTLLVIPVANSLAGTVGWRLTYQTIGVFSLAFVALWQLLAAEEPARCFYISDCELKFLQANVTRPKPKSKDEGKEGSNSGMLGMPFEVALHPSLWAVFFAHINFNYGVYYLTNWSPTYYSEVLHLKPAEAKYHLMTPYILSLITTCLSPMLVKAVGKFGWDLLTMRRLFTAAGFILAGLALAPVHQLSSYNPWISTALFSAANVFYGLTPNGFKANYLEITEQYIGVVSGYGNTLGTLASWAGPQFVAFLLQRFESWDYVLFSLTFMNLVASVNYVRSASVKPVEKLVVESKKAATNKVD